MATTKRLGLRLFEATDVANHTLINNVLNALDAIAVKLDTLAATGGHVHSGVAGDGTKIPYANLTGVPSSLPANGGNADTVDNKHAADFSLAEHIHSAATTSVAGFLSAADKTSLNQVVGRVNQSLTTSSSPTFNVVTAAKVIGAVYQ
jgi:hypothetical protein